MARIKVFDANTQSWVYADSITSSSIDLTNYAKTKDIPTKISQLQNDAGYLTKHQDISGKADKTGLTLGIYTDGLVYLFVDGIPVGTGIGMSVGSDVVGYVDKNNNIVLTGALAEGKYTVKYEMEDGTVVDIGELSTVVVVEIVNQIPISTDTNGSIYNGIGYKTGYRIRSSGLPDPLDNYSCTGFIPAKTGDKLYMDGMYANDSSGNSRIALYKADKTLIRCDIYPATSEGSADYVDEGNGIYSYTIRDANVAFTRFSVNKIMDGTEVVTVNQPIEALVSYSITNNLTNCINNNSSTKITKDSNYSATISANNGYELSSVAVTMGDVDITATAVIGGNISIANVTGDIVITGTAELVNNEIINLAAPNATNTNDWSLWCNNARIGSDGAYRSASGQVVTNWIEASIGDTLYIKGLAFTADTHNAFIYTTDKVKINGGTTTYWYNNGYATFKTTNGITTFTAVDHTHNNGMAYIRFGAALTGTLDDVVITKNQPIE